jgi:hypothetical protein
MWLYSPLLDLCSFSCFLRFLQSRWDSYDGGSARRNGATYINRTAQTQNERTQTSMPQVGFEPSIRVFACAKTLHARERESTAIGGFMGYKFDRGTSTSKCTRDTVPPVSTETDFIFIQTAGKHSVFGRLCGLVVRVPGNRSRGPGFVSRSSQIF